MDEGWDVVEAEANVEPVIVKAHGNGTGIAVAVAPTNLHEGEAPGRQRSLSWWTKFMARAPAVKRNCRTKEEWAPRSLFQ